MGKRTKRSYTEDELRQRKRAELLEILGQVPHSLDSVRCFMPKADAVQYLVSRSSEERSRILAKAAEAERAKAEKQRAHRLKVRQEKWSWAIQHSYRYVGRRRPRRGFKDALTGRRAKVAYLVAMDQGDRPIRVNWTTLKRLNAAGLLEDFARAVPPQVPLPPDPPTAEEILQTYEGQGRRRLSKADEAKAEAMAAAILEVYGGPVSLSSGVPLGSSLSERG